MRQAGALSYDSRCLKLSTYYLIYYLAVPPFATAVSDILVPPRYQLCLQIGFLSYVFVASHLPRLLQAALMKVWLRWRLGVLCKHMYIRKSVRLLALLSNNNMAAFKLKICYRVSRTDSSLLAPRRPVKRWISQIFDHLT